MSTRRLGLADVLDRFANLPQTRLHDLPHRQWKTYRQQALSAYSVCRNGLLVGGLAPMVARWARQARAAEI